MRSWFAVRSWTGSGLFFGVLLTLGVVGRRRVLGLAGSRRCGEDGWDYLDAWAMTHPPVGVGSVLPVRISVGAV